MTIRFGTSGWRSIIAEEFTFANVELVTESICRYLQETSKDQPQTLIVGHDSRFMGEKFSEVAAGIAKAKGFRVLICTNPTPTPTISHAIKAEKALGAINFTASHNPPEYQGIKFSTADGAPALPEVTNRLEAIIQAATKADDVEGGSIEKYDACPGYLEDLKTKIRFDVIAAAKGTYAYDPLWGTGRGYLDKVLRDHGLEVETIHDWRDVTFGGQAPEPGEEHLDDLRAAIKKNSCTLGIATDGDADRFGVIDSNGTFIQPNQLVALLADYLAESRGWKLGLARAVAPPQRRDRNGEKRGHKH